MPYVFNDRFGLLNQTSTDANYNENNNNINEVKQRMDDNTKQ